MNIVMIGVQVLWIAVISVMSGIGIALFVGLITEPIRERMDREFEKRCRIDWNEFTQNPTFEWNFWISAVAYAIFVAIIWAIIVF